ncbi:MAG: LysR family transcriptional regulator [Acidihalobacter sp.]|jgi:DNA-binding transcriptional LysR family regulator
MELRNLRAFVEVVRQGGFSQAAKKVFATQSTVSKAVKQLEDELGLRLLDRVGHKITQTAAGEIVFRRAQMMLTERDDLIRELDELRGLQRGVLRLGLPPIGSSVLFAPLFATYRRLYPGIEISLVEYGSRRLEEMLLAGEIELAASLLPVSDAFEWQDVSREPIMALLPDEHPCASGTQALDLTEIADTPFILFEAGFALNRVIFEACSQLGIEPAIVTRSGQIDFIVELVAAGMGVAFLPRMIAEQRQHVGVCMRELADSELHWHMALLWRRGGYLSHAARAWLELARKDL